MTAAGPSARRPRLLLYGGIAVAAVVVVIIGTMLLGPNPTPSPSGGTFGPSSPPAAVLPPSSPLIVSINRDGTGPGHVGYPIRVSAAAMGMAGVAGIELWAGGERVGYVANADVARPAANARWDWTPTAIGPQVLVARAYDGAGHVAQSTALRLAIVAEPPRSYSLSSAIASAGETLAAVAARAGGDPLEAAYWNPDLPAGPLPAGTVVTVPVLDPVVPPPTASATGADDGAAVAGVPDAALAADIGPIVPVGLATPNVQVAVKDCTLSTKASGGTATTKGFAFSVLPPSSDSFLPLPPVAPAGDGTATTSFKALAGLNFLTVGAYDAGAVAPSAIVPFEVPASCGTGDWQGDARLDGSTLITATAADRAYLYLKVGGDDWQRIPAAPGQFVDAVNGVFDFSPVLPPIAGKDLRLEAWGWKAGALVKLGTGTYHAPGDVLYSGVMTFQTNDLGIGTSLDIVIHKAGGEFAEELTKHSSVDRPGPNSTSATKDFKWQSTVAGITHLQWQILPYPLLDSTNPTPPFLIDTGTISVQGLTSGYFSVDLKPYLTGQTSGVTSATLWSQQQVIASLIKSNPYIAGATTAPGNFVVNPNGIWLPGSTPKPTAGPGGAIVPPAKLDDVSLFMPPPTALYVRVIPYKGTTPIGKASNVVSFDIVEPADPLYLDPSPPATPPQYDDAYTRTVKFVAPTGSNPAYYHCVKVMKGGYIDATGDWSNGTTHCRPKKDDSWSPLDAFESFVEWVGSVWDYISDGYDWIQDKIVDAVLTFVPCEQIASTVSDNSKEVCKSIAKTALQAVALAYGIPPEIPSWESTISAAKGDLRTFILENAETLPGVAEACGAADLAHVTSADFPTCAAVIDKAVDTAISQLVGERSKAAAAEAGVYVPPGVIVEPHPASTPQPPHFDITVTRTSAPLPDGTVCSLTGRMSSSLASWTWNEYQWTNGDPEVVQKTGAVHGDPFYSHSQDIAPLATGKSSTYQLWLTQRQLWFEPDGWNDHYAQQYAEWNGEPNHGWVLLQQGANVDGTITSNCTPDFKATAILSGQASQ